MLSSGPLSAERATRNGVCAVAHTKSAGILRLRSGVLLSEAHRRASVEARSRRTPALDLPAEAPSTARGLHGRHKLKTAAALRSGCFRSWMKGLFSEQRARVAATRPCAGAREASLLWPGGLDRSRLAARALTDRGRDPTPGCSACACPSPVAGCSETRPFIQLRKHPERSAAAVMNFAPAVPAARSRRSFRRQIERRRPSTARIDACAPMRSAQESS